MIPLLPVNWSYMLLLNAGQWWHRLILIEMMHSVLVSYAFCGKLALALRPYTWHTHRMQLKRRLFIETVKIVNNCDLRESLTCFFSSISMSIFNVRRGAEDVPPPRTQCILKNWICRLLYDSAGVFYSELIYPFNWIILNGTTRIHFVHERIAWPN